MHSFKHLRRIPKWFAVLPLAAAMLTPALAAPFAFPMETTPVKLDGKALGTQYGPGLGALLNTVVLVGDVYHMWAIPNSVDYPTVRKIIHATSSDGINFTRTGILSTPPEYWNLYPCGSTTAAAEPTIDRLRVSLVGDEWIMTVWNRNGNPAGNLYSYNTTVWSIGDNPSNLEVDFYGPLPAVNCAGTDEYMPGNNHVGTFGVTYSATTGLRAWLRNDSSPTSDELDGGSLGGYLTDLSVRPPTTSTFPNRPDSLTYEGDFFEGTGFSQYGYPDEDTRRTMVDPIGRTLDLGGGVLGTYYAFIGESPSPAREKEIRYIESEDGGATWSKPTRVYGEGQGEKVLVDGLLARAGFRAPEVVAGGERTYFWTRDFCDNLVMVTAIDEVSKPKLTIVKDFAAEAVDVGGTTNLTVTVTAPELCRNSKGEVPTEKFVHNVTYTDTLPINGGGQIALTGTVVSNPCGKLTISDDKRSFTLAEVDLAMNESCAVQVEVQGNVAGFYENVIPAAEVTNTEGLLTAEDARDTLRVGAVPPATVTPVPTTGPLSLAALAGLLGFFAVRRNRKSKKD